MRTRTLISIVLTVSLLSLPMTAFANKKGDKNFKRGMELVRDWAVTAVWFLPMSEEEIDGPATDAYHVKLEGLTAESWRRDFG